MAGLPLGYLLKRTLWAPARRRHDRDIQSPGGQDAAGEWFGIPVTRGMISFISIILRCMLTILAAFTLLASTGFAPLCRGLRQLGVPRILITLLAFLYRYAFILVDEFQNTLLAFRSRRGSSGAVPLSIWGAMTGQLLLRAFGRRNAFTRPSSAGAGKIPNSLPFPAPSRRGE